VLYGGILIALGQFSLGIHALPFFYWDWSCSFWARGC